MEFNYLLFLTFFSLKSLCYSFELISTGGAIATFFAAGASIAFRCKYYECCDDDWIHFNEKSLEDSLRRNFFGQHLADFAVLRTLRGFYENKNPKKALVLSFHGLTGSGKNYISSMIANCTYKKGTASNFVHIYSGVKDFPHKEQASQYMDKLQLDITRFTRNCGRSLFIFDEIDKMPPGVLDSLKPYVDYYEHIDGVDYRKNIFIFLSNAGSSSITELTLRFWTEGRNREDITMKDVEPLINKGAFNERGKVDYNIVSFYEVL